MVTIPPPSVICPTYGSSSLLTIAAAAATASAVGASATTALREALHCLVYIELLPHCLLFPMNPLNLCTAGTHYESSAPTCTRKRLGDTKPFTRMCD